MERLYFDNALTIMYRGVLSLMTISLILRPSLMWASNVFLHTKPNDCNLFFLQKFFNLLYVTPYLDAMLLKSLYVRHASNSCLIISTSNLFLDVFQIPVYFFHLLMVVMDVSYLLAASLIV